MIDQGQNFRLRIISPIKASDTDLARRQRRYSQAANPDTLVSVENLEGGPAALNSSGDILNSASAIYQQGRYSSQEEVDAILIDCVFDPAVVELQEATGVPTFGPTRVTLLLVTLAASRFSIITRSERQAELLADLVKGYGYESKLASARSLGISYEEAKQKEIFEGIMTARLREVVDADGAEAVMFGSTTMNLTRSMKEAAQGRPLFMPGIVALSLIEQLWYGGLWPR